MNRSIKGRILLVEDDESLRRIYAYHLTREGYAVEEAPEGHRALVLLEERPVDVVLTDVRMPGMDGRELMKVILERHSDLPVVVLTAYGTIEEAVEAMRLGAADYLTKPVEREALLLAVEKALRLRGLAQENRRLRRRLESVAPLEGLLGASSVMEGLRETIRKVAPSEATVLITGESGTGKEKVARALHALSPRRGGAFLALNCAALPKDLLESELFGFEKGAFTGALAAKPGKFLLASGGTLLLDEVGDMDLSLQAKLLRVLQERVIDPVGGRCPVPVDVRVLASTHRDLRTLVQEGRFREDLYWRLHVIPIHVPPLRDRGEDILLLFSAFYREESGRTPEVTPEAAARLRAHSWPGNVRELKALCTRLAVLHPGVPVTPDLLPPDTGGEGGGAGEEGGLWALERQAIVRALKDHGGNRSAAARALRIPRHVLLYRLKKFDVEPE